MGAQAIELDTEELASLLLADVQAYVYQGEARNFDDHLGDCVADYADEIKTFARLSLTAPCAAGEALRKFTVGKALAYAYNNAADLQEEYK